MMETLEFIKKVKHVFTESNQTERYQQFACALKDFKTRKISSDDVLSTAKMVFQGHESLFRQFMMFLPPELRQKIQVQESLLQVLESQAKEGIAFINKVRDRFGNCNSIYRSFLMTMCQYRSKRKSVDEVYNEMFDLFHGHADLIHEFEGFLNDNEKNILEKIKKIHDLAMEDRMIEVDLLLSNMNSTIKHVEDMLEGREHCLNEGFTQLQLRVLERLYTEHAPEVMEKLRVNPEVVLPKILSRLKEKKEELSRVRKLSNEFWRELHQLRKQKKRKLQGNCN